MSGPPRIEHEDDSGHRAGALSFEVLDISSEAALNARLATIFADSPWEVTAELREDGGFTYYFREKAGDPRPVMLLTSDKPPLLFRAIVDRKDVLLIPHPDNSWTEANYDKNNRLISFEHPDTGEWKCEFPSYIAIGIKEDVEDQVIDMTPYMACSTGLRVRYDGRFLSPVSSLINVSCYGVPIESRKRTDIKTDPDAPAYTMPGRLAFDLSGSTNPSLYLALFKEKITESIYRITRSAENDYLEHNCGMKRSRECDENFYKKLRANNLQVLLGISFYLGNEETVLGLKFDQCKMTGCSADLSPAEKRKNAQPLLDSLTRTIEERVDALLTGGERKRAPSGPDFPTEMPSKGNLEFKFFQSPYGQNIAGRLFQEVCFYTNSLPECQPAADWKKVIDWSLREGLPLFLSVSLAPGEDPQQSVDDGISALLDEGASDKQIETAIRTIFAIPLSERSDKIYERLGAICKERGMDRSASGASAALLGAWALRGDSRARKILFEFLDDSLDIASEEAKTVVARILSIIITDKEAEEILNKIKAAPDAAANSMLLSTLAGHEEFFEGLKILFDSYHPKLYKAGSAHSIIDAMGRIFVDPIIQTGHLKLHLAPHQRKLLSGNNWPTDLLQRVHEDIVSMQELSTDETADVLSSAIQLLRNFAAHSITREVVERDELDVNTDLTKRHIYPGLKPADIIRKGVQLARTAGREEAYISIEPDDDSANPVAIEVGIFETEGSTSIPDLDSAEFERFFKTANARPDDELTIVQWHIHPIGRSNRHMLTDNIPSKADLLSYLYFALEWRKRAPNAHFEFRILTPYGVLLLKPNWKFLYAIDRDTATYIDSVRVYQAVINNAGGQITMERFKGLMEDCFISEFVDVEGK